MAVGKIKVPKGSISSTSDGNSVWYWGDSTNAVSSIKIENGRVFNNDTTSSEYGTEIFDFEEYDYEGGSSSQSSISASSTTSTIKKVDFSHALEVCQNSGKGGSFSDSLNGVDITKINSMIKDSVNAAGYGTRDAVIAAAYALAADFPEITGNKYFYTIPSQGETHNGMAQQEGLSETTYLDCRAFIQWVVHNAGYDASALEYIGTSGVGTIAPIKSDIRSAQPGDIFSTDGPGHTWMVVEVTEDGYYAAEEYGGAEINFYSWEDALNGYDAKLYDMQGFYSDPSNKR